MDIILSRYIDINKALLSAIGLWPYRNSRLQQIYTLFILLFLISGIVVQLAKFITTTYTVELLVKILSSTLPCIIFIVKFHTFYINAGRIKKLLERIETDWHTLKNVAEQDIIRKHMKSGRLYTVAWAFYLYPAVLAFIIMELSPCILDVMFPSNVSRPRKHLITTEYFIDEQKYFYLILVHVFTFGFIMTTLVIATESLLMVYAQHACGLFKITNHRLQCALSESILKISISHKAALVCRRLIDAVKSHKQAIEFSEYIQSTFVFSYFILLLLGVASLSLNLLCTVMVINEVYEFVTAILIVFGHCSYVFWDSYVGQILLDNSNDVFEKIYVSKWYDAPLRAQKLMLFMMQRSMKSFTLSFFGAYVVSFEGFATFMSVSLSYFTVFCSLRT